MVRPLRLLDLHALDAVHDQGSIFDPTWKERLERVAFLRRLRDLMTRPVMPGYEISNYLPTQVVADYLANECDPPFDGMIFKSVQVKSGRNVVLFRRACRVVSLEPEDGERVEVNLFTMTEDGAEPDFCVTTAAMNVGKHAHSSDLSAEFLGEDLSTYLSSNGDQDWREPALEVDVASMQVHEISWVGFTSNSHQVQRRYPRQHNHDDSF